MLNNNLKLAHNDISLYTVPYLFQIRQDPIVAFRAINKYLTWKFNTCSVLVLGHYLQNKLNIEYWYMYVFLILILKNCFSLLVITSISIDVGVLGSIFACVWQISRSHLSHYVTVTMSS